MSEQNSTIVDNKVCVYAICKNEGKYVDKWVESVKEADLIVVLDTGSTDDTKEKFQPYVEKGIVDFHSKTYPDGFRFDVARNDALDLIPSDYNIRVSVDLDEIFEPGWADEMRALWVEGQHERGSYRYAWSHMENGEPGRIFMYNKAHSRNWRWEFPVHERLYDIRTHTADEYTEEQRVYFPSVFLHHYPDSAKSRGSYLPMLELRVKENPDEVNGLIYLAHEYSYRNMPEKSIKLAYDIIDRFPDLSSTYISNMYLFLGDNYRKLKNSTKAYESYFHAIQCDPTYREAYLQLATLCNDTKQYELSIAFVHACIKNTYRHFSWIERDTSWTYQPYDILAIAYYYSGHKIKSLGYAYKAYEINKDNERLKNNVEQIIKNIKDEDLLD